jgi:hypothetical protein
VFSRPSVASGQRLGDELADYTVVFNTDGGQKRYSPSNQDEFSQFRIGTTWTLSLNAVGAILDVKP